MIRSLIKLFIEVLLLTIVVIVIGLFAAPSIVSEEALKKAIIEFLEENTGKKAVIEGGASFSFLPQASLKLNSLKIINPSTGDVENHLSGFDIYLGIIALIKNDLGISAEGVINDIPIKSHIYVSDFNTLVSGKSSEVGVILVEPISFNIKGILFPSADKITMSNIKIFMNGTKGEGEFEAILSKNIPEVNASLTFDRLNIDEIMGAFAAVSNKYSTEKKPAPAEPLAAKTISKKEVWNNNHIDLSALKGFNANIKAISDSVTVSNINMGKTDLRFSVKDGVMNVNLAEVSLYEGSGVGSVTVDASGEKIKIAKQYTFSNIRLGKFLKDAASFERVEGSGSINASVLTEGSSEADFVRNLQGTGSILLKEGKLKRIDLSSSSDGSDESVQGLFNSGNDTEIANMNATFTIQNGIISNSDLTATAPFSQITGKGAINLPEFSVNYLIVPKVSSNNTSFAIPVRIKGDLRSPEIKPDAKSAVIENIDNVIKGNKEAESINNEIKKHFGTDLKGVFEGLFGR